MNLIFDKTDKGREEISTRKYRLAPRLRTLLLLIDGKQSTDTLLQKIAGLDSLSISELQDSGFIQTVGDGDVIEGKIAGESNAAEEIALEVATNGALIRAKLIDNISAPAQEVIQVSEVVADENAEDKTSQFKALQAFYTETIRTKIGLRGYSLQQIVDHAESMHALRELREPYLAAVTKAKGESIAQNMAVRLDQLLDAENADMLRK